MDVTQHHEARRAAEIAAGKAIGHEGSVSGSAIESDRAACSCGWKSRTYCEGPEYAWSDWVDHIRDTGAAIEYPAAEAAA